LKEHRYLGRYPLASSDDLIFVELQPIDIHEMNELYTEHSFAFVGLTGTFGPSIERELFSA
ncbi:MAG: hypothetical protein KDA83_22940, partial [Planctomycetales bacterium]|nr:hypothetical protein [Planctomycetales bacterium]